MRGGPLAGKRIGLLTTWASRRNGGVFEAVALHTQVLQSLGAVPVVVALADEHSEADAPRFGGAERHLVSQRSLDQFGYGPRLLDAALGADLDLLHLHGIWHYASRVGARWKAATGRPYAISPHGMLDPWVVGRNRWKKAIGRVVFEKASWRAADLFHALSEVEAREIALYTGLPEVAERTVAIPNPAPEPVAGEAERAPLVVHLGRLHAKKNLVGLMAGWERALPDLPDGARLRIAGWGSPEEVRAVEEGVTRIGASAEFLGPLYGEDKAALLGSARFLALPTYGEGLPMAVLEAWAHGTPTIMTAEARLPVGFERGAALECGTEADSIAAALRAGLTQTDDEWTGMADAARALVAEEFSQAAVGRAWEAAYARLLG